MSHLVRAVFPDRAGLARHAAVPLEHVRAAVRVARRPRVEPDWVVLAEAFTLLAQSRHGQTAGHRRRGCGRWDVGVFLSSE